MRDNPRPAGQASWRAAAAPPVNSLDARLIGRLRSFDVYWHTTRFRIDLRWPRVMGIVNVTPDSFSDGGLHADASRACRHAERLVADGADVLDIGAESTRPGAPEVPVEEEWSRLEAVLREAVKLGVPVSVDTWKPAVMQRALDLGADIINDVHALSTPGAEAVVAAHPDCGVCLMHMRGVPADMQQHTAYGDVVSDVRGYLADRLAAVQQAGVGADRIVLDPGIGFGKTVEQNFALLRRQQELADLGRPLLLGWSRKSSLGAVTGRPVHERLAASVAAAVAAACQGAHLLRVHDVGATVDALRVWQAAGLLSSPPVSTA